MKMQRNWLDGGRWFAVAPLWNGKVLLHQLASSELQLLGSQPWNHPVGYGKDLAVCLHVGRRFCFHAKRGAVHSFQNLNPWFICPHEMSTSVVQMTLAQIWDVIDPLTETLADSNEFFRCHSRLSFCASLSILRCGFEEIMAGHPLQWRLAKVANHLYL